MGDPDCTSAGDSAGDPKKTSARDADEDPHSTGSQLGGGRAEREKPTIVVRGTRPGDIAAIERIAKMVYPGDAWTFEELLTQYRQFPEGQLVAVDAGTGEVVGMAASLLIRSAAYSQRASYARMTAYGTFRNHDPRGETLYGAEVMVDPTRRRQGIGAKLYDGRRQLARRLGVSRILAGARLPGYSRYADTLSAEQYVANVLAGNLSDPTLSFQLRQGFRVVCVVPRYAGSDTQSHGYAALIEWEAGERGLPADLSRTRRAAQRGRAAMTRQRVRPDLATWRRARAS